MTGVQSHGILNKQKAHSVKKVSGVHFLRPLQGRIPSPVWGAEASRKKNPETDRWSGPPDQPDPEKTGDTPGVTCGSAAIQAAECRGSLL